METEKKKLLNEIQALMLEIGSIDHKFRYCLKLPTEDSGLDEIQTCHSILKKKLIMLEQNKWYILIKQKVSDKMKWYEKASEEEKKEFINKIVTIHNNIVAQQK